MTTTLAPNQDSYQLFCDIVGQQNILPGCEAEALVTDVYRKCATPKFVIRPSSVEQLQACLEITNTQNFNIAVRGGGASYTDGYAVNDEDSVLLDLSKLNNILEINEFDNYVTVEAGVTWEKLKEALDKRGLRTPFWGPFSGLRATVGGSMSQNTISHGSGAYGISASSALSFDVILADGSVLSTGSASASCAPFLRHFGPDLTGLFTGDCSTLGIKARITLPLIRKRSAHRNISFAFSDFKNMHEAMRRIASERLEDSHFALDQALSQGQIARQDSAKQQIQIALSILSSSPSIFEGIKQLIKGALSAKRVINTSALMTHYIVEGTSDAEVKSRLQRMRELTVDLGKEIPATVPTVVRGMPFAPFFNTLGPAGERWVPLHGIFPHSKVQSFHEALCVFFENRKSEMDRLGVWYGGMFSTIESSGFLYELALYWPDEITAYHREVVPEDYLSQLQRFEANPEARAYIHTLKKDLVELFVEHGAVNFQLGKAYPYASRLTPQSRKLIATIKKQLDPKMSIANGSLEL